MVSKEHDRDERHDGERADQRGAFAGDGGELHPERAASPRVEGEPPFDAVGEVPALAQLSAQIIDAGGGHGAEYSTGRGVVSSTSSMDSEQSEKRRPRPGWLSKFLSGTLLT